MRADLKVRTTRTPLRAQYLRDLAAAGRASFGTLNSLCLLLAFAEFAGHAVEYTIDEVHRLRRGKTPRNLQGLIDHDRTRRFRESQKLSHPGAQKIAIHGCHAVHPPVFGVALDQLVDLLCAFGSNTEQVVGKAPHLVIEILAFTPERLPHLIRVLLSHFHLKQHLQRQFARLPASAGLGHRFPSAALATCPATCCRNDAISTAARPAWNPLLPAFNPARSMACSRVSQVSAPKACGTPVSCAD